MSVVADLILVEERTEKSGDIIRDLVDLFFEVYFMQKKYYVLCSCIKKECGWADTKELEEKVRNEIQLHLTKLADMLPSLRSLEIKRPWDTDGCVSVEMITDSSMQARLCNHLDLRTII